MVEPTPAHLLLPLHTALVIEIIQVVLKLVAAASEPTVGKETVGAAAGGVVVVVVAAFGPVPADVLDGVVGEGPGRGGGGEGEGGKEGAEDLVDSILELLLHGLDGTRGFGLPWLLSVLYIWTWFNKKRIHHRIRRGWAVNNDLINYRFLN